ncbi:TAXI family TRAP transporter solute-binding subunit [Pelagibius sp. 7325]|uniref:TAXI family TRAP transporter solute-binding subunit n=1 Tax=Pelagibius sp. 7325 TaxID=3131994 RepID=UPI0030EF75C4
MTFFKRLAVGCAGVLMMGTAAQAETLQLNLGGSTPTSTFFPYYTAIANAISESSEKVRISVLSTGGFAKNAALMKQGDLKFAGISPDLIASLEESGYKDTRVLWWALPAVQLITARKDAHIENFADFNGKCFHPGMSGSSQEKNMILIIRKMGFTPNLYLSDSKDAVNAIKDDKCLGRQKAIGSDRLDAESEELNLTTPLWPVGWTEAQRAKIKQQIPWMDFVEMPAGIVEGAPSFYTHAIWIGFVASADLSEEIAYELVKGMDEGIASQKQALRAIRDKDILQQTLAVSAYPLHAGAVRYYREKGLEVPERLLPPEMR